ncbi:hypothetical protein JCM19241_141 [Vibrio ishigakensis]|uniref:Uncharacterized protein n=1 Tax=Vibrio ishigakensis TaxID=1481914 RepID=A0A0B8QL93_9VIBR|nr:hypothetical protein JCM19241_141 [Vibrio ishigakensis]
MSAIFQQDELVKPEFETDLASSWGWRVAYWLNQDGPLT